MSGIPPAGTILSACVAVLITAGAAVASTTPTTPDPTTSAPSAPGDVLLVSAAANGEPSNGLSSFGLSVSASGRYVAFASMATNLEPSDPDPIVDIYVKDLVTGGVELASRTAGGVKANAISTRPSISADGRRVAFLSAADNLSPDDTDGFVDVYVKDLRTGELTLASRTETGVKANGGSDSVALSGDGSTVAFGSNATNLAPGVTDGESHVYVKRLDTGALTRVDGGTITRPDEQVGARGPALSADGWTVAFVTDASGIDPADSDQRADVYVRDLRSGRIRLASINEAGVKGDQPSTGASLSADGHLVAFETASANLVAEDQDDNWDVYVKHVPGGSLRLASTDVAGTKANRGAGYPSLSPDGRYLAFSSDATNFGIETPPLVRQIYRKDLVTGVLDPVSVAAGGGPAGDYLSIDPSISAGGEVVAFLSPSTNLVPDGDNRVADVFAKLFAPVPGPPPDTTPPTAGLTAAPSRLRPFSGRRTVRLSGSAADAGGVDRVSVSVTDEYGAWQPVISPVDGTGEPALTWQREVSLDTWLRRRDPVRAYRITATVSDRAGNVTTISAVVVVVGFDWTTSAFNSRTVGSFGPNTTPHHFHAAA
jgi:Tol biopolymer transport system component